MAGTKSPNAIDAHVGNRLRIRRLLLGLSQEKLGESLGITFQQVQKYEKGTNRISASRLYELSRLLDVQVGYFFEGLTEADGPEGLAEQQAAFELSDVISTQDGIELTRAFTSINNDKLRRKVVDVVKTIAMTSPD